VCRIGRLSGGTLGGFGGRLCATSLSGGDYGVDEVAGGRIGIVRVIRRPV